MRGRKFVEAVTHHHRLEKATITGSETIVYPTYLRILKSVRGIKMKDIDTLSLSSRPEKNQAFHSRIFRYRASHTHRGIQAVARIGNKKHKDSIPVLYGCVLSKDEHENGN